jgi:ParB family chromosome partitioning protein
MAQRTATLQQISPDKIRHNPDNPRLVFREDEMQQLMDSIKEVGIKVPVSLYEDGLKFVLLDGERRWRCAKRLNLSVIPAIIQPKPSRLENILMMFNIHNVRVDWDPMPMALKLRDVRELLEKRERPRMQKPSQLSPVFPFPACDVR